MRVYLAGPIFGMTCAECNDWRDDARARLYGCEVVDPMARDYRGREDEVAAAEIVEGDEAAIMSCGAMLANCEHPSWGTAMEIAFAHSVGIPVFVVAPRPWSPWLVYHALELHEQMAMACSAVTALPPYR